MANQRNTVEEFNTNERIISFIAIEEPGLGNSSFSSDAQHSNSNTRYESVVDNNIIMQFKEMQEDYMNKYIPLLTKLLSETSFETGYCSQAELFFERLYEQYGTIADTILQNIYLQNMYENKYIIMHLLFIVANLPPERRNNIQIIPIAGLANPDIEIQDLSVKCFEAWGEKRHLKSLKGLLAQTNVLWFKEYLKEVIDELEVE